MFERTKRWMIGLCFLLTATSFAEVWYSPFSPSRLLISPEEVIHQGCWADLKASETPAEDYVGFIILGPRGRVPIFVNCYRPTLPADEQYILSSFEEADDRFISRSVYGLHSLSPGGEAKNIFQNRFVEIYVSSSQLSDFQQASLPEKLQASAEKFVVSARPRIPFFSVQHLVEVVQVPQEMIFRGTSIALADKKEFSAFNIAHLELQGFDMIIHKLQYAQEEIRWE